MMARVELRTYQLDAINRMKIGCILNGKVGTGKSLVSLAFYFQQYGGKVNTEPWQHMINPADLYIITTARKRDTKEWDKELLNFQLSTNPELNNYKNKVVVDSWNNIQKYDNIENAFFIFDEQHVVGSGAWVKAFIKIAKKNKWILLSATPGDTWSDYIPVFIANGFYKNKTEFLKFHAIYDFNPYRSYPVIKGYFNEGILLKHRADILVDMNSDRKTIHHNFDIICSYDKNSYQYIADNHWDPFKLSPIETPTEYCMVLRKLVNSDPSRQVKLLEILEKRPKVIIFYNYDYELDILRKILTGTITFAEWNGHKHEPLPICDRWAYLVQYAAGCEGWNCIQTDTIVFYSLNYSYKVMQQATGRIDRMNTPFVDLYYFYFKSTSKIDRAITNALRKKKQFNERGFAPEFKKVVYNPTENRYSTS